MEKEKKEKEKKIREEKEEEERKTRKVVEEKLKEDKVKASSSSSPISLANLTGDDDDQSNLISSLKKLFEKRKKVKSL